MMLLKIISAVFSLIIPICAGLYINHVQLGILVALGALSIVDEGFKKNISDQFICLFCAMITGSLAFLLGIVLTKNEMASLILLPVIVFVISTVGRISRLFLMNISRFMVFLIIGYSFNVKGRLPYLFAFNFIVGTIWAAIVFLLMRTIFFLINKEQNLGDNSNRKYTAKQLLNHWKNSLKHFSGWKFQSRITLCFIIAQIVRFFIPDHHSYWILLTIVLVVQINIDNQFKRTINRMAGTFLGIILSTVLVFFKLPVYFVVFFACIIVILRQIFREKNYLLYSAVMSPLVIILLDFGNLSSFNVLLERLFATAIGCIISLIFGYYIWIKMEKRAG